MLDIFGFLHARLKCRSFPQPEKCAKGSKVTEKKTQVAKESIPEGKTLYGLPGLPKGELGAYSDLSKVLPDLFKSRDSRGTTKTTKTATGNLTLTPSEIVFLDEACEDLFVLSDADFDVDETTAISVPLSPEALVGAETNPLTTDFSGTCRVTVLFEFENAVPGENFCTDESDPLQWLTAVCSSVSSVSQICGADFESLEELERQTITNLTTEIFPDAAATAETATHALLGDNIDGLASVSFETDVPEGGYEYQGQRGRLLKGLFDTDLDMKADRPMMMGMGSFKGLNFSSLFPDSAKFVPSMGSLFSSKDIKGEYDTTQMMNFNLTPSNFPRGADVAAGSFSRVAVASGVNASQVGLGGELSMQSDLDFLPDDFVVNGSVSAMCESQNGSRHVATMSLLGTSAAQLVPFFAENGEFADGVDPLLVPPFCSEELHEGQKTSGKVFGKKGEDSLTFAALVTITRESLLDAGVVLPTHSSEGSGELSISAVAVPYPPGVFLEEFFEEGGDLSSLFASGAAVKGPAGKSFAGSTGISGAVAGTDFGTDATQMTAGGLTTYGAGGGAATGTNNTEQTGGGGSSGSDGGSGGGEGMSADPGFGGGGGGGGGVAGSGSGIAAGRGVAGEHPVTFEMNTDEFVLIGDRGGGQGGSSSETARGGGVGSVFEDTFGAGGGGGGAGAFDPAEGEGVGGGGGGGGGFPGASGGGGGGGGAGPPGSGMSGGGRAGGGNLFMP
uniref:Uncharacterized protein n=1 Tax=Chromera velia CCMP2878 TaxID=1169474 RepID=A0A0G4I9Q5_9ALVE|eukprot:Cvel_2067.t1-p1 / transcript=Cvel_2067.t1 / gene=Cvel_2067 / organism=Chromera_velia_CCMP2878 / gene_product=hypothetical protein / transcript_product=hypothetical protein / location=Cvel_scaffold79:133913-146048(-) / protein_length=729 / sequence_SO=supercontig / SO=protein_coding / is_pseudo=false